MNRLRYLTLATTLLVSACTSELATARSGLESPEQTTSHYRLIAVPLVEPASQKRESAPFWLLAPGSAEARIVDLNNAVVRSAPAGGTIFGFRPSPNRQWVLLDLSNAEYAVASVDGLKDIARPPKRPDAPDDATVFEWFILDDDRLIGYASLPSLEPTKGLTASEKEGLPSRGTLVYLYTIATGVMTPVEIDESVPRPFGISTDSYGNLAIEPHSGLYGLGMKVLQVPVPEP